MTRIDRIFNEINTLVATLAKAKDPDPSVQNKLLTKFKNLLEKNRVLNQEKNEMLERVKSARESSEASAAALEKAQKDHAKKIASAQKDLLAENKQLIENQKHLEDRIKTLKKNLKSVDSRAASTYKPQITKLKKKLENFQTQLDENNASNEDKINNLKTEIETLQEMPSAIQRCLDYTKHSNVHPREIKAFIVKTMERTLERNQKASAANK